MRVLRIATRGSALALAQTEIVIKLLAEKKPELETQLIIISTKGDQNINDPLWKLEGIGFFTTQLEQALLDGMADIAVHSFKDLPTIQTEGLTVAAVPARENPADCVVSRLKVGSMIRVAAGSFAGTSSLRRQTQLMRLRADLNIRPIRGNVQTRLRKLDEGQYDMLVMAAAGLIRLGLQDRISFLMNPREFLPAPAQGALAVQTRADDTAMIEFVGRINDVESRRIVEAERLVLKYLHPGCHSPVGVYGCKIENLLELSAFAASADGQEYLYKEIDGPFEKAQALAETLAEEMLAAGAKEILEEQ